jgi:hypothetical protein
VLLIDVLEKVFEKENRVLELAIELRLLSGSPGGRSKLA